MPASSDTKPEGYKTFPLKIDLELHLETKKAALLSNDQTLQDYIIEAIKEKNARVLKVR